VDPRAAITSSELPRSSEWADLKLNTALGSYTELKHDTVLYAKQAYSNTLCEYPEAYVEPATGMYNRLARTCESLRIILETEPMGPLPSEWGRSPESTHAEVFASLSSICIELGEISEDEMDGKELTSDQVDLIKGIYTGSHSCGSGHPMEYDGWLLDLFSMVDLEDINFDSSLVTDICTGPYMERSPR